MAALVTALDIGTMSTSIGAVLVTGIGITVLFIAFGLLKKAGNKVK